MLKWVAGLFLAGVIAIAVSGHVQADKGFPLVAMKQASVMVSNSKGLGSGVIVGPTMVLTAGHVCESEVDADGKAVQMDVTFDDGDVRQGRVIGFSKPSIGDYCVLYVPVPDKYAPAEINCKPVYWGEEVAVVGHPLGIPKSVSFGNVANTDSDGYTGSPLKDAVALAVAATYGNSGGPVFNSAGEVVGLLVQGQLFVGYGPVWQTGFAFMTPSTNFCSSLPGDFK